VSSLPLLATTAATLIGCGPAANELAPIAPAAAASSPASEPTTAVTQAGPIALKWEEIDLPLGEDGIFQKWMVTTALAALEGQAVRISGTMYGDVFQPTNIREFKLVRHSGCQFGAAGHPAHLIFIELQDKLRTSFTTEPITVEGTFHIRPYTGPDGRTWALYHMDVTSVKQGEA
jgi:uncharacterized protein DUF3299